MNFKYNKNVNKVIDQATKNLDNLFGLLKTARKQANTLSNLVIDETVDSCKKVTKEVVAAGDKITEETLRVAQGCIDNSIKTAFPE